MLKSKGRLTIETDYSNRLSYLFWTAVEAIQVYSTWVVLCTWKQPIAGILRLSGACLSWWWWAVVWKSPGLASQCGMPALALLLLLDEVWDLCECVSSSVEAGEGGFGLKQWFEISLKLWSLAVRGLSFKSQCEKQTDLLVPATWIHWILQSRHPPGSWVGEVLYSPGTYSRERSPVPKENKPRVKHIWGLDTV